MKEQVLYRRYRPQAFKDVLGQDHIVGPLEGALKQGNIAHAYLFAGSRGTGKTSLARIIASEIGVSEKDLYEIDAASNRGIDDIRELKEAVRTMPFDSPYKVYIIDEVHMLTKEAFNALLKTLEEPPQHVVFILATTEVEKLPETIVSRCQTYTFRKPSQKVLTEMVTTIAKKEGYSLEPAAADLIGLLADGSFRDAHGVLQKIIFASSKKKITRSEVESVTGAPRWELIGESMKAFNSGTYTSAIVSLETALKDGVDATLFLKLLLHHIRTVLLLRHAPDLMETLSNQFDVETFSILKKYAEDKNSHITTTLLRALLDVYPKMNFAIEPGLPIELAILSLSEEAG